MVRSAAVVALFPGVLAGSAPSALVAAWLRELDAAGRSAGTLRSHRWHALSTFAGLAHRRAADVEALDLASVMHAELVDYLAEYRHAPDRRYTVNARSARTERSDYTMSRRTATLRTFFAWAAAHSHIPADPAAGLPNPKIREHLPRAFEVRDALLLFEAARLSRSPERDTALVAVALGAGPRMAELAGMRLSDLLGRPPTHALVTGKGGRERRVPLTARAQVALEAYLPVRAARLDAWQEMSGALWLPERLRADRERGPVHLSRGGMGKVFDRLLTDAGLRSPGLRAHVLRGTAATALLRAGRSVREVQVLLGHAQIVTTARYLLVTDDDLASTVAANPLG